MKSLFHIILISFLAVSCTGGQNATPDSSGTIKIVQGDDLDLDMSDLLKVGYSNDLSVTIRKVSNNYSDAEILYDITSIIKGTPSSDGHYKIILPKDVGGIRPLLISVIDTGNSSQFSDVIYKENNHSKPGIASTLTYELMKYYPNLSLSDYQPSDYYGIKEIIQTKVDQMLAESERVSLGSIRFAKLMRFFKNGMAFNDSFLTSVKAFKINYDYTLAPPDSLTAAQTPEQDLTPYLFAQNFKVSNVSSANPFNHYNTIPKLSIFLPGAGTGIFAPEGTSISVRTLAVDQDDDFLDQNYIATYTPRVLPLHLPPGVDRNHLPIPEKASEYEIVPQPLIQGGLATYSSRSIGYDEAIDKSAYTHADNTPCSASDTDPDCGETSYRDVYSVVSDGAVKIPFRWQFRIANVNRAPQIIKTADGKMNSEILDRQKVSDIAGAYYTTDYGNLSPPSETGSFKQHASHCETDLLDDNQSIRTKDDGPWSCVFTTFDPDLDDDPNAAMDNYQYVLENYEPSTEIFVNGLQVSPNPSGAPVVTGAIIPSCTDAAGKTHLRCGVGHYQVTVDNSVKVASAQKESLEFQYDVRVTDRPQNGLQTTGSVVRKVKFTPIPPRLVNFDQRNKPAALPDISNLSSNYYSRKDIYFDEVIASSRISNPANTALVGINENNLGSANRPAFHFSAFSQPAVDENPYLTQPRGFTSTFSANTPTFDGTGKIISFTTPNPTLYGNMLNTATAPYYNSPRSYDSTCEIDDNNFEADGSGNIIWDQRPARNGLGTITVQGGIVYELNVVDLDNLDLRPSEPYEPVYWNLANNMSATGSIYYCIYNNPNSYTYTYDTYGASVNAQGNPVAAVDPNTCTWSASPPTKFQPISIFYDKLDADGVTHVTRKMVYHRLRIKWQPKDSGIAAFYINNMINDLRLYGDRYRVASDKTISDALQDQTRYTKTQDPFDPTTVSNTELNFWAAKKNHKPCIKLGSANNTGRYPILHDTNTSSSNFTFATFDENRTYEATTVNSKLVGKYQAEIISNAANTPTLRDIRSADFSRNVPFIRNCDPDPTPAPFPNVINSPAPYAWYAGPDYLPRIRLTSPEFLANTASGNRFCILSKYEAYIDLANRVFDKTVLFQASAISSPYTVNLTTFKDASNLPCYADASITLSKERPYYLLATPCTSAQTAFDSGTGVIGAQLVDMNPSLASNGGFSVGTFLTKKLFPSFYSTTNTVGPNLLLYDIRPIDSFILNESTGSNQALVSSSSSTWLDTTFDSVKIAQNLGIVVDPAIGYLASASTGYVDWDRNPTDLSTPTPTPTPAAGAWSGVNVYSRISTSKSLQIFVKDTASAAIPVLTADPDPFDVMQFTSITKQLGTTDATNLPTLNGTGVGRANANDCMDAPSSYNASQYVSAIQSVLLVQSQLTNFKKCVVKWTPNAADVGKKYTYTLKVQDNLNAVADPVTNVTTTYGAGGRSPAGVADPNILNNNFANTHGPLSSFVVEIESIEKNLKPYFVTVDGGGNVATNTKAYSAANASTSGNAWNTILGGSCSNCSSSFGIKDDDLLLDSTVRALTEDQQAAFAISSTDDNITPQLKTVTAIAPRKVYIVNRASHSLTEYTVPSFSALSLTGATTIAGTKTITTFNFNWTPTDTEAFYLSNADGFLIPITITDQAYSPASDASFPDDFRVPALTNTVWIWANLSVKNNTPTVVYLNNGVETPLSGATLNFEVGKDLTYTVRVKDTDRARVVIGNDLTSFGVTKVSEINQYSASTNFFTQSTPAPINLSQSNVVYQEFTIKNAPLGSTEIGTYNYNMTVADPGDLAKGLCADQPANPNCLSAQAPTQSILFNIAVVGKPTFAVPNITNSSAVAYVNNNASIPTPFSYPLSLSVSKPSEKGSAFFIGILSSASIPMKKTVGGTGMYVNENYVLKWPEVPADSVGNYTVPLYAVKQSYCGTGSAVTFIRYNQSSNTIESCGLSAANRDDNSATQNLSLTVTPNYNLPTLPSIPASYGIRETTGQASAENQKQYADFKGRCLKCVGSPNLTSDASPSGLALNPGGSTSNGFVEFLSNNYKSRYAYNYSGSYTFTRTYTDATPSSSRSIEFFARKGETVKFVADLSSAPTVPSAYYRWYVNGCLVDAGKVANSTAPYSLQYSVATTSLMSGLNNICTGQYSFAETNAGALGKLKVRLSIVNNIETTGTTTDNATTTYLWTVNILNTQPSLTTPIALSSNQFTGTTSIALATTATYLGNSYLAYTDTHSTSGTSIRLRSINASGTVNQSGYDATQAGMTSPPTHLGIDTDSGLNVAMSKVTSVYPASATDSESIFKLAPNNYGATLVGSTLTGWNLSTQFKDVAGFSVFSRSFVSTQITASYKASAMNFSMANSNNFYLIDGDNSYGYRAIRNYWSNDINTNASVYGGSNTPTLSAGTWSTSTAVRRNIVSDNKLFQLIGAKNSTVSNFATAINLVDLSANGNYLTSSNVRSLSIGTSGSEACAFDGSPIDGVYVPTTDTLYVLLYGTSSAKKAGIAAINVTSGTCRILADETAGIANPSLDIFEFNPSISKLILDSNNGMVYGVLNRAGGVGGQLYFIDIYTEKLYLQSLPSSINPKFLIFSKETGSLQILDGDKSTGTTAKTPTLYPIW